MIELNTEFLEQSKEIILRIKASNDSEKLYGIIEYIEAANLVLAQHNILIKSLLANQAQIHTALTATNGSIANLHDRLSSSESQLDAHDKVIDIHSSNLDSHTTILDLYGSTLDVMGERIDLLDS
jgi:hypothetical protein